jgi:hypothetical protein
VKFGAPFTAGATVRGTVAPTSVDAEVAKLQKTLEGAPFEITIEPLEPQRLDRQAHDAT